MQFAPSRREAAAPRQFAQALAPYATTVLRLLVGVTFLIHGLPKLQTLDRFAGMVGGMGFPLPGLLALLVAALEVGGGLLLIVGLATRWVSLLLIVEMIVTTVLVKLPRVGFVAPPNMGAGAEFDLLLLASLLILLAYGPGHLSSEQNLLKRELWWGKASS